MPADASTMASAHCHHGASPPAHIDPPALIHPARCAAAAGPPTRACPNPSSQRGTTAGPPIEILGAPRVIPRPRRPARVGCVCPTRSTRRSDTAQPRGQVAGATPPDPAPTDRPGRVRNMTAWSGLVAGKGGGPPSCCVPPLNKPERLRDACCPRVVMVTGLRHAATAFKGLDSNDGLPPTRATNAVNRRRTQRHRQRAPRSLRRPERHPPCPAQTGPNQVRTNSGARPDQPHRITTTQRG